jgi:hypothetical protein
MTQSVLSGQCGKKRNVVLTWLIWPLITLGIYHLVWWYKINREARDFDPRIEVSPGLAVLALIPGFIIIFPPYVSVWRTGDRIRRMQIAAGMGPRCNPWIGLILSFFFSLHSLYYQVELNAIWDSYGAPEPGSVVPLRA